MKETNKTCSNCSVFVQKQKESIILTDSNKNSTKRRFLKPVLKVDIPQICRSLQMHWNKVNAQTWRFLKTMGLTKTEQCERTKEDKFRSVFEIRWIKHGKGTDKSRCFLNVSTNG